jgi:Tfp pilus assembly protein FimT
MISLAIIGVMVMAVAPSLSHILADNRQATAASEITQFLRNARALAAGSNVAMLITFDGDAQSLTLRAGMTNRCRKNDWSDAPTVALIDMEQFAQTSGFVLTLSADDGVDTNRSDLDLCFQPNGDVYWTRTNAETALNNSLTFQNRELTFTVARTLSGDPIGVDRDILLPLSGNARAR